MTETQRQLETYVFTKKNYYHRLRFLNLFRLQKQFEEAKEEANKSAQETDRLLQVVQMTQEEQNAKEKTIMDLQQ